MFPVLQLLQQLHSENMLGYRFPIGLEEQIKKWDPETIKAFHERWYFPANATLFIVGDIGSVSRTVEMIEVLSLVPLLFLRCCILPMAKFSSPCTGVSLR